MIDRHKSMIYLASPYSDPDPAVMEQRFDAVCRKAGKLMNAGFVVYSPIAHCHPIAMRVGLPRDWAFWQKFDRVMIRAATDFYVLRLPGWETSKGVAAERKIAEAMGLRTVFINP
jgi:nucleoside 2-deoxyribosyltransferase